MDASLTMRPRDELERRRQEQLTDREAISQQEGAADIVRFINVKLAALR